MKLTREQWLNAFTQAARPHFKKAGLPLPKQIRCSVGFTSQGKRGRAIGECWFAGSSADGHAEVFIHPSLQSATAQIGDVLTHELIHAGGITGHGADFKKIATALGLEGKMTATTAGPKWHEWADPIIKELGKFPGAELKGQLAGGKKKQTTRMLKLVCDECDWTCRTSSVHIYESMSCPLEISGCGGKLRHD